MDVVPLAGMLFSLLMVLIIAGSILMFPLMRRLGRLLELRIEERRSGLLSPDETAALRVTVESLQAEVGRLAERQAFTERLLESGLSGGSRDPEPGPGAGPERPDGEGS